MHLFIHIGDHKTGSTSIQAYLRRQSEALESAGIHVPEACTYSPDSGHHHLAFELLDDKRWDRRHGGLDALVAELRDCRVPNAVISCEDLSLLVSRPESLQRLETTLRAEGHTLSWLMFLRRVDDFSESLYCEHARSGHPGPLGYPGYALAFLFRGSHRNKFCDYSAFARQWRSHSTSPLHLYDYDDAMAHEGVLPRFLAAIGAPASLVEGSTSHEVLNRRRQQTTRHFRRLFRPLLMARFHRANQRLIDS